MSLSRRSVLGTGLLATGSLFAPAIAQAKPRVIIIGGGPGGATAARYLAKDSNGAIDVTLVEPSRTFITCFHSNLYLGGYKPSRRLPIITTRSPPVACAWSMLPLPPSTARPEPCVLLAMPRPCPMTS